MSTQHGTKRQKTGESVSSQDDSTSQVFADLENWTPDSLDDYLKSKGLTPDEAQSFKELLQGFQNLKKPCDDARTKDHVDSLKVFNDPIHGHIELHPLCVQIIDTPQFQRLRYIKQMGCGYLVFPGAAHNRFEHSLGVCHLAGVLCRTLRERQPELNITEKDVLCVEIAGLCHDLGHGPFSHVFDQLFIPAVIEKSKWTHEKASVDMFDYLIEANKLKGFTNYGLDDQDIHFIKEQIVGPQTSDKPWPYQGRTKDKSFLYEIVANKRNGIDVDKWDYFLRDCYNLGITSSFNCHRFMKFCRVIEVDGKKQICARDKEVENLYDMFHARNRIYRSACQHKVNKITECMIVEALEKANQDFKVTFKEGDSLKSLKMSEAIDNMAAYTNMTDDIILQIIRTNDVALAESRRILEMVQRRQLYKYIGQAQPPDGTDIPMEDIPKMKAAIVGAETKDMGGEQLNADQLIIHLANLNYGMGQDNPVDHVRFYSKANPNQALPIPKSQVSQLLPERFAEQQIRVHCKRRDDPEYIKRVSECFKLWCYKNGYTVQMAGSVLDSELSSAMSRSQVDHRTPEKQKSLPFSSSLQRKASQSSHNPDTSAVRCNLDKDRFEDPAEDE